MDEDISCNFDSRTSMMADFLIFKSLRVSHFQTCKIRGFEVLQVHRMPKKTFELKNFEIAKCYLTKDSLLGS